MTNSMQRIKYKRQLSESTYDIPRGNLKKYGRSQSVWNLPSPHSDPIARSNSSSSAWSLSDAGSSTSDRGFRRLRPRSKSSAKAVEGLRFSFTPCLSGDIDAVDSQGRSLLYYAVRYGQVEQTKLLLEAGCFINQRDNQGFTPLHEAIGRGHIDIATLLLQEGEADTNICDESGETPLHMAVSRGQLEVVRFLHKYGADVNICDASGTSPLCLALQNGWIDIAEFLLDKQCDVNKSSSNGTTCLSIATQNTKIDSNAIAKRLLKTDYDFKQDAEWLSNDQSLDGSQIDSKVYSKVLERAGLKTKSRRRSFLSSGKKKIARIYKKSF